MGRLEQALEQLFTTSKQRTKALWRTSKALGQAQPRTCQQALPNRLSLLWDSRQLESATQHGPQLPLGSGQIPLAPSRTAGGSSYQPGCRADWQGTCKLKERR